MKTEFEIKMTTGGMYRFLMYHSYHGFSGIFSAAAGLGLLALYAFGPGRRTENGWIYLLFGVLFLVYQPWTLYMSAVKQVKLSPVFRQPLHYTLTEEGIEVCQGESTGQVSWADVTKVRETARNIFVYTGSRNACIWIKSQMAGQEAQARTLLTEYVAAERRKLRRK